MFEFFLRKTVYRSLSKEELPQAMLQKDKIKMQLLGHLMISLFGILPLASLLTLLVLGEHTLSNIIQSVILILAYSIFAIWFAKRFRKQIELFNHVVVCSLYNRRYVVKGNALSKEDFDTIKKEKASLCNVILMQECTGYCYSVCFEMLKCLKKGSILFVAVKCYQDERKENGDKEYTMHVLYVHNDWCFDTYSQRQFPLEEVLKRMRAKTYTSFDYDAVDGKTYEEFRAEHYEALKEWCQENNCYQKWLKED